MRRIFLTGLMCLALTAQAHAGAWPREEGQLFIATGGNVLLSDGAQLPVHYDPTLYAEYGLTDRVTLGLDMHTADAGRIASGFVFARIPLGDTGGRDQFAATLAFGGRIDAFHPPETLLRGGLSWGRGLDHGWVSIDASATLGTNAHVFRPKADFTWGQHWNDNWTTAIQVQSGQGFTGDYYAKISPTITYRLTDSIKINLGAVQALTGDRGAALKLETWMVF